jgi:hypothetical protein
MRASKRKKRRGLEALYRQALGRWKRNTTHDDTNSKAPWFNQQTFFKHLLCAEPCDRYYGGYKLEESLDTPPKGPALS